MKLGLLFENLLDVGQKNKNAINLKLKKMPKNIFRQVKRVRPLIIGDQCMWNLHCRCVQIVVSLISKI